MGGNLALALALRHQDDVAGLALLATPWDFHADRPDLAAALGAMGQSLAPQLALFGELATETLQFLFCALDPLLGWRKFIHFAGLDADSEAARDFVALEDWLNGTCTEMEYVRKLGAKAMRWYEASQHRGRGTNHYESR